MWKILAIAAATIAVMFLRRPDQFLHPYIWVEDGYFMLPAVAQEGAISIFDPVAGYLLVPARMIAYAAYRLSFLHAPEIEVALTALVTCLVMVAVARSPTHLRWPYACALAALAVPTDAEVFAVAPYIGWWLGLLLPLALLWDTGRGREPLRWAYILIGGLSSPLIVPFAGLLWVRSALDRRHSEVVAAMLASTASIAQAVATRFPHQTAYDMRPPDFSLYVAYSTVSKYIGDYFYTTTPGKVGATGAVALAAVALLAWLSRRKLDRHFGLLALAFAAICAAIAFRVPAVWLDRFTIGPRYFFYPFVLLSWGLIWLAACSSELRRAGIVTAMLVAVTLALPHMSRRHDAIDWQEYVKACASADVYFLPAHYSGNRNDVWRVPIDGETCRSLIDHSLF